MSQTLMAIPNLSCGKDSSVVARVGAAYQEAGATLLNTHFDVDHERAVHTLAGDPGKLAKAVAAGVAVAVSQVDLESNEGVHPHVGVVDVAPIVYLTPELRGAAAAEALVLGDLIGTKVGVPVFLYGVLAGGRTRAQLRKGGLGALTDRVAAGELKPDFGPGRLDQSVGATLVAARPPMVAFNLVLARGTDLRLATEIAAEVREGGRFGLPGVRALGFELETQGLVQLSANLEDPDRAGIAELYSAVSGFCGVESGELIGLAPRRVLDAIPESLEMPDLDRELMSIEGCLRLHRIDS